MTMAHAIVNSYPTFTRMDMNRRETEILESLLEENVDEDDNIIKVPSNNFKQIWEGTDLSIHRLNCGRFNIRESKVNMDGKEEPLQERSSLSNNIQR